MVAIYARLSVNENGERDESLETQSRLLLAYAGEHGLGPARIYVDSDVSGTCFDRPGLSKLVADIKKGLVQVVLVKDLSRLGRNNGETLIFLDFLHDNNIRLLSLGDNYDSFRDDDEVIGIKTWVNEHYARDISKKVRINLKRKMQSGEFLGRPPFGYLKSSSAKNKLVVNEKYREVIKKIFELYIAGWGYRALAGYMQDLGIPTPSQDKGYPGVSPAACWNGQHIRRIITNRVYCGDTVQGVSEKVSFKTRKTRRLAREKWIIVPGTHEAIISREMFDLAQKVRIKRTQGGGTKKQAGKRGVHLFTGFLICARCGSSCVFRRGGYICGLYNQLGRKGCSSHYITEKALLQHLLEDIKSMAEGVDFRASLLKEYRKNIREAGEDAAGRAKRLEKEINACKNRLQAVYLDKVRGLISEELFVKTREVLEREVSLLAENLRRCRKTALPAAGEEEIMQVIQGLNANALEESDIDRTFLENFVRKIILRAGKEKINSKVWGKLKLKKMQPGGNGPLVIYNVHPY